MADLTPDLQVCLSLGSIAKTFHSLQSLSVSYFHVILGLPGTCFPSTCMSQAVLTAPLERSTHLYQWSLLSFRMRSRSSLPSHPSSSLDLMVTMSCSLTVLICLITALSFHCRHWRFDFVNGQVSLARSIALGAQELYMWPCVLKERWQEERTGSSSLNFFQVVFTRVFTSVDDNLVFYVPFNIMLVISKWWKCVHERLCAMKCLPSRHMTEI